MQRTLAGVGEQQRHVEGRVEHGALQRDVDATHRRAPVGRDHAAAERHPRCVGVEHEVDVTRTRAHVSAHHRTPTRRHGDGP